MWLAYADYSSSYGNLLAKSKETTIHIQSIWLLALEVYKTLHNLIFMKDYFLPKAINHNFRIKNNTRKIPVPRSINVTDVLSLTLHKIFPPWYWNRSCVILYLSDSTLRISIFFVQFLPNKKTSWYSKGQNNQLWYQIFKFLRAKNLEFTSRWNKNSPKYCQTILKFHQDFVPL